MYTVHTKNVYDDKHEWTETGKSTETILGEIEKAVDTFSYAANGHITNLNYFEFSYYNDGCKYSTIHFTETDEINISFEHEEQMGFRIDKVKIEDIYDYLTAEPKEGEGPHTVILKWREQNPYEQRTFYNDPDNDPEDGIEPETFRYDWYLEINRDEVTLTRRKPSDSVWLIESGDTLCLPLLWK